MLIIKRPWSWYRVNQQSVTFQQSGWLQDIYTHKYRNGFSFTDSSFHHGHDMLIGDHLLQMDSKDAEHLAEYKVKGMSTKGFVCLRKDWYLASWGTRAIISAQGLRNQSILTWMMLRTFAEVRLCCRDLFSSSLSSSWSISTSGWIWSPASFCWASTSLIASLFLLKPVLLPSVRVPLCSVSKRTIWRIIIIHTSDCLQDFTRTPKKYKLEALEY